MLKNFFAGANTGEGFVNRFKNINNDDGFMYIIKGGSGTGKSSMMKKIGEHFLKKNFDVEYYYCSSDVSSLDGVRICKLNVCVVDGTSPHIMEADIPNIKNKIINVGEFIKNDVYSYKNEIEEIIEKKNVLFDNLYIYLKNINALQKINQKYCKKIKKNLIFEKVNQILTILNLKKQNKTAKERKLFLSAIQPEGIINLKSQNNFNVCYTAKGNVFLCDEILTELKAEILRLGYDVISFSNVFLPNLIEAIYVPQTNKFVDSEYSIEKNEIVEKNNKIIDELILMSEKELGEAKNLHKQLEEFYIKNMNFKGVEKLTKRVIDEIEKTKR